MPESQVSEIQVSESVSRVNRTGVHREQVLLDPHSILTAGALFAK